jgi:hypothetical protein
MVLVRMQRRRNEFVQARPLLYNEGSFDGFGGYC